MDPILRANSFTVLLTTDGGECHPRFELAHGAVSCMAGDALAPADVSLFCGPVLGYDYKDRDDDQPQGQGPACRLPRL